MALIQYSKVKLYKYLSLFAAAYYVFRYKIFYIDCFVRATPEQVRLIAVMQNGLFSNVAR